MSLAPGRYRHTMIGRSIGPPGPDVAIPRWSMCRAPSRDPVPGGAMNVLDTPRHRSAPGPVWLGFAAILSLVPRAAPCDEAHLAWTACAADAGTSNQTFACDTNAGANVLVGSFI